MAVLVQVTGGRNGYGAKLANIFSTEFIIETCDGSREKRYKQVFTKNMSEKSKPKITSCKAKDNWTSVQFKPDFGKFGMDGMEEDTIAMMRKRTYDLAGVLGSTVKVYYNGERLPVKTFQDYVNLYLGPKDSGAARVYEKSGTRWEVVISPTDGQFQQVSCFVLHACAIFVLCHSVMLRKDQMLCGKRISLDVFVGEFRQLDLHSEGRNSCQAHYGSSLQVRASSLLYEKGPAAVYC